MTSPEASEGPRKSEKGEQEFSIFNCRRQSQFLTADRHVSILNCAPSLKPAMAQAPDGHVSIAAFG
jgi:hypothetical protein